MNMVQYKSFAVVASFFGLWLTSYFSNENQILTGFIFILTFGILHGANDLLLLKNLNTSKMAIPFLKILLYYLGMIFFSILLFYIAPIVIIVSFIFISGYHFGEQQLEYINKDIFKILANIFKLLYGLLILFLIFEFHKQEVVSIITEITLCQINPKLISYSLYIILLFFSLLFTYMCFKLKSSIDVLLIEIFYLIVFCIIFRVSSLIWGFAIYFIIWHSIPSIINQISFLYGSFTKKSFISYLKSAAIYWILSLIGFTIFYFLFNNSKLFNSIFFSFLAAITFPHVLVISKMFNKK